MKGLSKGTIQFDVIIDGAQNCAKFELSLILRVEIVLPTKLYHKKREHICESIKEL